MLTLSENPNQSAIDHISQMVEHAEQSSANLTHVSREMSLYELRILAHITGRQTGSTEAIVHLFNPKTDIYVGETGRFVGDFIKRLQEHHQDDQLQIQFLNLNSKNLKDNIQLFRGLTIKRVWFDCGGHGIYKRSNVVTCVIRNIEKSFKESLPIYVIV